MKNANLLKEALSTLIHSWGGDTPQEAIWTYNELVDFVNAECNTELKHIEDVENYSQTYTENDEYLDTFIEPSKDPEETVEPPKEAPEENKDPNVGCLVGIESVWWWNFRKDRAEELIAAAVELSEVTIKRRNTNVGWFITKTEIYFWYDKIQKAGDFKTFLDVI